MDNLEAREILRQNNIEIGMDGRPYEEIISELVGKGVIQLESLIEAHKTVRPYRLADSECTSPFF